MRRVRLITPARCVLFIVSMLPPLLIATGFVLWTGPKPVGWYGIVTLMSLLFGWLMMGLDFEEELNREQAATKKEAAR